MSEVGAVKRFSSMFYAIQKKLHKHKAEKKATPSQASPSPVRERSHTLGRPPFFEYLVVVSVRMRGRGPNDGYQPQIIYQLPKALNQSQCEEEQNPLLQAITLFCFPEGVNWAQLTEYSSETFSFVLTESDGSRRNGYCRRLLPSGRGVRPLEAYCIISTLACFSLFSKIFDEVEKRRQISKAMIYPFMQSLRETAFPAPGETVTVQSFIPDSGTEMISLTRPLDSWLEHVEFRSLFLCVSDEELLQLFSAALLERRILFVAEELSTLSQVLHAVAALLYPFVWQHTFISIVPKVLLDVYLAPTPYLLGIQKNLLHLISEHTDLLIVDLSARTHSKIIARVGDEELLIPSSLQKDLLQELCQCKRDSDTEELNRLVSEAFLNFFVKTIGHFDDHIKRPRAADQPGTFQKRNFLKAVEPTYRHFVEQFVQTQMFDLFIQDEEKRPSHQGLFCKKISEHQQRRKQDRRRSGGVRGVVV